MKKIALLAAIAASVAAQAQLVTGTLSANADDGVNPPQNLSASAILGHNDLLAQDGLASAEAIVDVVAGLGINGSTKAAWPPGSPGAAGNNANFNVTDTENIVVVPANSALIGTTGTLNLTLIVDDTVSTNTSSLNLSSTLQTATFDVTTGNNNHNPVMATFKYVYGTNFQVTFFAEDPIPPGHSSASAISEIIDWGLSGPPAKLKNPDTGNVYASTPEPASLLGLGLPALVLLRRRKAR